MPSGESILGIIDASSRWTELHVIQSTNSKVILSRLERTFTTHGYPVEIVTDNAPNLVSVDVKNYCANYGIKHRKIGPYWPQANAEIERFYRTLGKALKIFNIEGKNWREEIYKFIFDYRTTPHCTTNASPAKLLMNRNLRGKIPKIDEVASKELERAKQNDNKQKLKMKSYADYRRNAKISDIQVGDAVLVKQ